MVEFLAIKPKTAKTKSIMQKFLHNGYVELN
jgi:hypothetical protein